MGVIRNVLRLMHILPERGLYPTEGEFITQEAKQHCFLCGENPFEALEDSDTLPPVYHAGLDGHTILLHPQCAYRLGEILQEKSNNAMGGKDDTDCGPMEEGVEE